jgi:indolepyruvate ferredoxin oxidoreductase
MIGDPDASAIDVERAVRAIGDRTSPERNVQVDAVALSEALFAHSMPGNAIVIGAAWQLGLVPVSRAAMEEAFRLNGAAVETNIAAFHWGRAVVARPAAVGEVMAPAHESPATTQRARRLVDEVGALSGSELERILLVRTDELLSYQGVRLARFYLAAVLAIIRTEQRWADADLPLSQRVARNLYTVLAYKDEYEVARLHLDHGERERLRAQFGSDATFRVLLHPPLLRAMGLKHKLSFGPWFDPGLRALRAMRRLRGTPLDIFGYAHVRRVERALPREYLAMVARALEHAPERYDTVAEICELPAMIRGYEQVKLRAVDRFRERAQALLSHLEAPRTGSAPTEAVGGRL